MIRWNGKVSRISEADLANTSGSRITDWRSRRAWRQTSVSGSKSGEGKNPVLIRCESKQAALKAYSAIPHDPPGRRGITAAIWCWLAGSGRNLKTSSLPSSAACAQQCLGGRDNQEPFSCFSNVENAINQGIYQLEFIQSVAKMDAIQFKSRTSYIPWLFRLKNQTDQLIKSAVNHQAFL